MKLLSVIALCALATAASCASLEPRNEAAELLMETAQLDQNEHDKRSFGSSYGSYSPAFSHEENHVPSHYPSVTGDLWGFKRAIIGALWSAVRAVAGGSIAVKGQVIKGAGGLVQAQGRLISTGGQAVSDFGRGIAAQALHSAPTITYHPKPAYVAPQASYGVSAGPGYAGAGYSTGYSSGPSGSYHHGDGVLTALQKAGAAKVNVATSVGSAVGSAVAGAAGAVAGVVGNAAAGAAKLAVGAAGAVTNHVAHKFAGPAHAPIHVPAQQYPSSYAATPAGAQPSYQAYGVPTYGGSLEDSFGHFDDSYKLVEPSYSFQPSINYDLH